MVRLLYVALIIFIIFKTIAELMDGGLSGISSGKSLHGYTINIHDNPIEYLLVIGLRTGAIIVLIWLLKYNSEED